MYEEETAPGGPRRTGPYREPPGTDLSRILSLSDGVFAFALTLLVLQLTIPTIATGGLNSAQTSSTLAFQLQQHFSAFAAYALTFLIIALWWTFHHRLYRYIERYDQLLVWLNLLFLLTIAVMPFVLGVFVAFIQTQTAAALYAATQAATGAFLSAIWWHATGKHRLVDPKLDSKVIWYYRWRGLITPAIFLTSIGITYLDVGVAEFSWVGAFVGQALLRRYGGP